MSDFEIPGNGTGGQVNTVVAGTGVSVDASDPVNPVISVTGGGISEALAIAYAVAL